MVRLRGAAALLALAAAACSSATTGSPPSLTPDDLVESDVDLFGVVVDIPNRKSLGSSSDGRSYSWQAEHTLLERGTSNVWISAEILQIAGLPVLDQVSPLDFTGGMYRDTRYRLGGTIDHIAISNRFDVRMRVQWQLYDTETGGFAFEGESNGFARGQNLGRTGIRPNAMVDAFESCLGDLMGQPAFQAAMGAATAPAPTGEAGDG